MNKYSIMKDGFQYFFDAWDSADAIKHANGWIGEEMKWEKVGSCEWVAGKYTLKFKERIWRVEK